MAQQDEILPVEEQIAGTSAEPDDNLLPEQQGPNWADVVAVAAMLGGLALIWWSPYWIASPTPNCTLTFLLYWPLSLIWILIWVRYGRLRRRRNTQMDSPDLVMGFLYILGLILVSIPYVLFSNATCSKVNRPDERIQYQCVASPEALLPSGGGQPNEDNSFKVNWFDMTLEGDNESVFLRKTNVCIGNCDVGTSK